MTQRRSGTDANVINYEQEAHEIAPVVAVMRIDKSISMVSWKEFEESDEGKDFAKYNNLNVEAFQEKCDGYFKEYEKRKGNQERKVPTELSNLFDYSFIVGEAHHDISPKAFLIQNMVDLKKAGFDTLYMEFLYYDEQASLDQYFKTKEMNETLSMRLSVQDSGRGKYSGQGTLCAYPDLWEKNNYAALVKAAIEAGIRVVGLDIGTVFLRNRKGENALGSNRIRDFNYTAAKIIEIDQARHPSKFIVLMGNSHVSQLNEPARHYAKKQQIFASKNVWPGVADILGVARVYIEDIMPASKSTLQSTDTLRSEPAPTYEFIRDHAYPFNKGDGEVIGLQGDAYFKMLPTEKSLMLEQLQQQTLSLNKT